MNELVHHNGWRLVWWPARVTWCCWRAGVRDGRRSTRSASGPRAQTCTGGCCTHPPHPCHAMPQRATRWRLTDWMDATWPLASCPSLVVRVHFVPRFDAGEKYLQLLAVADVVLHPFPFGGSRTSAEGEAAESEGASTRHLTTTTNQLVYRVPSSVHLGE